MAIRRFRLVPPPQNRRDLKRRWPRATRRDWRIAGASVRGFAHRSGSCQDAWYAVRLPGQRFVAAVADGAGSAAHGGIGAAIAVSEAVAGLARAVEGGADQVPGADLVRAAVQRAADAVARRAARQERPIAEYATTLSVVVGGADGLAWGQVGDGVILTSTAPGTITTVSPPDNGAWINETCFITSTFGLNRLTMGRLEQPVSGVALITDGLRRLALRGDQTPFPPFFEPMFAHVRASPDTDASCRALYSWLQRPEVTTRTSDDVTLVLIARPLQRRAPQ